tara:strand:- start:246 stop:410 length:165 start_codon:yes stop_codon:yes gene_type:complete
MEDMGVLTSKNIKTLKDPKFIVVYLGVLGKITEVPRGNVRDTDEGDLVIRNNPR